MANENTDGTQTDLVDEAARAAKKKPAKPTKAIVTKPFSGCRDGVIDTEDFDEGDEIEGDLAAAMIAAGCAKPAKG